MGTEAEALRDLRELRALREARDQAGDMALRFEGQALGAYLAGDRQGMSDARAMQHGAEADQAQMEAEAQKIANGEATYMASTRTTRDTRASRPTILQTRINRARVCADKRMGRRSCLGCQFVRRCKL